MHALMVQGTARRAFLDGDEACQVLDISVEVVPAILQTLCRMEENSTHPYSPSLHTYESADELKGPKPPNIFCRPKIGQKQVKSRLGVKQVKHTGKRVFLTYF